MDANNRHFEILNKLQTGVVVHAPDAHIIFCNQRACELLGLTEDQLRAKTAADSVWHFVDEDGCRLSRSDYPVNRAIAGSAPVKNQVLGIRPSESAELVWLLVSAVPELDDQGELVQVVVDFHDITERIGAQHKKKVQEAFTAAVLDSMSEHIAVLDKEANIVAVNEAWRCFARDNGALPSLEVPVGMNYLNTCSPVAVSSPEPEAADSFEGIRAVLAGERPAFRTEYPCHSPTEQRWFRMSVTPLRGEPGGAVVSHLNITERKKTEESLRWSQSLLQRMSSSSPLGFLVIDKRTDAILYFNQRLCEIWHIEHLAQDMCLGRLKDAEISAACSHMLLDPAAYAASCAPLQEVFSDLTLEDDIAFSTGQTIHRFTTQLRDDAGQYLGRFYIFEDISARKTFELEARRNMQLLHESIEAIDEAFVIFDANERLVYCNEKYRQLYPQIRDVLLPGTTFEEIIRRGAAIGFYTESVGRVEEWVTERLAAYRSGSQTRIQHISNGRVVRAVERKMADGHTVGFRIDITELVKATEAALAASRSKGQFLANMSHEIRTPMNAILGMLKLLQNTTLTRQQLDYADKAESAARSLLGLINDVLDFSKVEAGKIDLDIHAFRFDRLLRDVSVVLAASVGSKPLDVLFNIDPTLPEVLMGDAMRLRQVLINLGGNAIKFTAKGQVVIAVQLKSLVSEVAAIDVRVEDSGIGIAPENHQHVFAGFSQAEASTTRKFGGTGLGLAISQRLVHLMGGQLGLSSQLGQGTTFRFELALSVASHIPPELTVKPRPVVKPRRALVVDDNPVAVKLTARMVTAWGWSCEQASCGEQAVAHIQQHLTDTHFPFEVIYLDCYMPDMDGWETARQIRALCREAQAPEPIIIMLSTQGRDTLAHRDEEEQSLLNGFLVKPVTASMLFDAAMDPQYADSRLRQAQQLRRGVHRLRGLRLLVVEDNLINQQVAEELLAAEGAQVTLAANGKAGVEAVARASPPFDAVLMDIQMPVMDGYAATRDIRNTLGLSHLPIIAMTANALESDRLACLAAGMNEHVGKPFDMAHLASVIQRLIPRA